MADADFDKVMSGKGAPKRSGGARTIDTVRENVRERQKRKNDFKAGGRGGPGKPGGKGGKPGGSKGGKGSKGGSRGGKGKAGGGKRTQRGGRKGKRR